jgi:hypothetical protein
MLHTRLLLGLLFAASGCAEQPDPTTSAIATAAHHGGVCTSDTVMLMADRIITQYECDDRALRGIGTLVYAAPE